MILTALRDDSYCVQILHELRAVSEAIKSRQDKQSNVERCTMAGAQANGSVEELICQDRVKLHEYAVMFRRVTL
jgi:DNA-binding FrmR family transcriptional regulator